MNKQTLKSLSIPALTLIVMLATSAVAANAQTSGRVYAQIPFDFVVGDKTMSAGKYLVSSQMQDRTALLVQNIKAKDHAIRLTNPVENRRNNSNTRLVFHRYGQTYFLAEVWQGGDSTGWSLHASKAERALQRQQASIAQNRFETVELIASLR
jgi:hypothetical protein